MIEIHPLGIEEYAERHTDPMSQLHQQIWKETHERTTSPRMMVGPLEGAFLRLLVRSIQARTVLEIGMFTGYSALAMAEALPPDGRLVSCDINEKTAEMAREFFAQSANGKKIEVRIGPAAETLKSIRGPFDLCFIDANKEGYPDYYEAAIGLVRKGGLIVLDNMLRSGRVLDPKDHGSLEIDALNRKIREDRRVENVLLPLRDGVMLAFKL